MAIEQADLIGTAFIGVFAATNDKVTFVPPASSDEFVELAAETLGTEVVKALISESPLLGTLCAMNSRCIVLPKTAYTHEIDFFSSYLEVVTLDKFTAVGNMIAANDKGLAVSPLVDWEEADVLSSAMGVPAKQVAVAGLETTGSCLAVTNKGFLANPRATSLELEALADIFGVTGEIGSLNYGNPFVRGSLLANSNGAIVGTTSTPFELGRVDDALFFKK